MNKHIVIGTAGHVDHGKTALVRALTGTDTDRWAEEKRRGITIDLGFAHLELDGATASVVDVPGHEDFVRNMVAGATGVDVALMVVAADESVMPQTLEHLAILEFLGVTSGVVAVTKADLVEPEWLELVAEEVKERLWRGGIAWEGPVSVSAETGTGLDELRTALAEAATRAARRTSADLFRLPVDRVFSVAGAGTVVTGTTWAGSARVGDEVRVLPGDERARIRSIECHGEAAGAAVPGRRTAMALVGLDRDRAARGSTVVTDPSWRAVRAVDALITLLPTARPLTQRSRVRFHLGTAEVLARLTPADSEIRPGETGMARLRLESDVVCRWGDRAVIRAYSPVTTVGGCVVVDPWPAPRPRRPAADPERHAPSPHKRVVAFVRLAGPEGVRLEALPVRLGVPPGDVDHLVAALAGAGVNRVGNRLVVEETVREATGTILADLRQHHSEYPLRHGLAVERLRTRVHPPDLADHVLAQLEAAGAVVLTQGIARVAEFAPQLSGAHRDQGTAVRRALADAGLHGLTVEGLSEVLPPEDAVEVLDYLANEGTVARVGGNRYYDRGVLRAAAREVVAEIARVGEATPAALRERLGVTRKYLIPLLEWLDAQGVTARAGDVRHLGPQAHLDR